MGLYLDLIPLVPVAVLCGAPVAAWLTVPAVGRQRRIVLLTLAGLAIVLFGWSQWRPGVLTPPLVDFGLGYAFAASVIVIAGIVLWKRENPWPGARAVPVGCLLAVVPLICCCLGVFKDFEDDLLDYMLPGALLHARATVSEVSTLPPATKLMRHNCPQPWVHGPCADVFVLAATDGTPRAQSVERIVEHYRGQGWPLRQRDGRRGAVYHGCREMAGILRWEAHCMDFSTDPYDDPVDWGRRGPLTSDEIAVYVH